MNALRGFLHLQPLCKRAGERSGRQCPFAEEPRVARDAVLDAALIMSRVSLNLPPAAVGYAVNETTLRTRTWTVASLGWGGAR